MASDFVPVGGTPMWELMELLWEAGIIKSYRLGEYHENPNKVGCPYRWGTVYAILGRESYRAMFWQRVEAVYGRRDDWTFTVVLKASDN
jgi:hypothetical protein